MTDRPVKVTIESPHSNKAFVGDFISIKGDEDDDGVITWTMVLTVNRQEETNND